MHEYGFSLRELSREIGKSEDYLSLLTRRPFQPGDSTIEELRQSIRKRGIILSNYDPEKQTLSQLSHRSDLLLGRLADRFGVSRQAINSEQVSDALFQKIVKEIHTIGARLIKLAS